MQRLGRDACRDWLNQTSEQRLETLFTLANRVRRSTVGDEVHVRALLEISNFCTRKCHYCGLRAERPGLDRYRMSREQILACALDVWRQGYRTLVLQAGEDPGLTQDAISDLVHRIKSETDLAVTLSLGERSPRSLAAWRKAGADRYLLRFETSNRQLYRRLHPPSRSGGPERLQLLRLLEDLGYEVGSGVLVGLPDQSMDDLIEDLAQFVRLDLDMIGIGPFLPHPQTPLGQQPTMSIDRTIGLSYRMLALSRILCPEANMPCTTALSVADLIGGLPLALERGANVVMLNVTPSTYRRAYDIYPGKATAHEPGQDLERLRQQLAALGRSIATGPGARVRRPCAGQEAIAPAQ